MNEGNYLLLMCLWFCVTIAIETTVLFVGLSARHSWRNKLFAGVWLTACTYPIIWLAIPYFIDPNQQRALYLLVAETFAPAAECLLFWLAFERVRVGRPAAARAEIIRDIFVIVVANLASFAIGAWLESFGASQAVLQHLANWRGL